jgi:hypothetical protein
VHRLYHSLAEGKTVVIEQELAAQRARVDLRTLQRAVVVLRDEERARIPAMVRLATPPGQQIQIDFRGKVDRIAGQSVKVYLMAGVLR